MRGRRLVLSALAAALAASCSSGGTAPAAQPLRPSPLTQSSSTTPTATTAAQPCAVTTLKIAVGHTGTGGGQQWGYLTFQNTGTVTCSLSGWPSLRAMRPDGTGHVAERVSSALVLGPRLDGAPKVTLAPGEHADAVFMTGDNPRVGNACPEPYRALLVSAPGSRASVRLSAWIDYAGTYLASCYAPDVGPVLPSHDLYDG